MHVKVISQKNSGREKQISIRCENPFLQDVCLRKRVLIVSSHRHCRILPAHKFLQQYCWVRLEQSVQLEPQVKTSVLRKPADAKREAASIAFL